MIIPLCLFIRFQVLILLDASWVWTPIMILSDQMTVTRRIIFVGEIVCSEILLLMGLNIVFAICENVVFASPCAVINFILFQVDV